MQNLIIVLTELDTAKNVSCSLENKHWPDISFDLFLWLTENCIDVFMTVFNEVQRGERK